jgi:hypothetical protein
MIRSAGFPQAFSLYPYGDFVPAIAPERKLMTNEQLQKQINALTQHQPVLAAAVNQLSTLSSNNEIALELDSSSKSCGDLTSSIEDFAARTRNYKHYVRTRGRWMFDFLTSQAALDLLRAATVKGLPAVAGIAESVMQQSISGREELTDVHRQFIGAVVRYRMEANGYRKTGKEGYIPYKPFTKGQLYRQILDS